MVLLIAAALLARGLYFAQTFDPGFETRDIAVASFDLRGGGYNDDRAEVFQRRLKERLEAMPSVDAVAQARVTPLSDSHEISHFSAEGESEERRIEFNTVSPEYFALLNIPIVRGRNFSHEEASIGAHVAIITESTGRKLWPGQDPVGKTLEQNGGAVYEVVGVARDARVSRPAESGTTYLYLPAGPKNQLLLQVMVHNTAGYASGAETIREAVAAQDPQLGVDVAKLEDNLELWRAPSRIVAGLSTTLGTLALVLASIGLYASVSYAMSRRTR